MVAGRDDQNCRRERTQAVAPEAPSAGSATASLLGAGRAGVALGWKNGGISATERSVCSERLLSFASPEPPLNLGLLHL